MPQTGSAEPIKMDGNRAPALEEEHINWIKSKFDEKSDLRIADLHNDIQKAFTFTKAPSMSSIYRIINDKLRYQA
ncbi:uncharacterized protein MEPE_00129 [Melanopsichium pennsylvanicum]|uniref:Uncharacterized protein n=1 Tax=Melanopsichium pennsylvanicum TaxID=63383 RepID=A0AAJ4XFH5_9BASI|nr:uncharacterized protein MEPE_00129 [Melanopsichium pennsylvanicum]